MANKLGAIVEGYKIPMGTTPEGVKWAMKALHPASENIISGIPDGTSRPTAPWNIMATFDLTKPTGSATESTWDADVILFSHPLIFGYYHTVHGADDYQGVWLNPAFGDHPYPDLFGEFLALAERYRQTYLGVTCTPVCSSLSNQGTITVAQYPTQPRHLTHDSVWDPTKGIPTERPSTFFCSKKIPNMNPTLLARDLKLRQAARDLEAAHSCKETPEVRVKGKKPEVEEPDTPQNWSYYSPIIEAWVDYYKEVQALAQLPNTFIGQFKDGCYAPLKLSDYSLKWRNARAVMAYAGATDLLAFELDPTLLRDAMPKTSTNSYPYVMPGYSMGNVGFPVIERSDKNIIHMSFRGLSESASAKIVIRSGFELEPMPASPITPFMRVAPESDEAALIAYGKIVRQLKDAYPEDYNSWEKLVNVIDLASKAAGTVIPGASLIGDAAKFLYNTFSGSGSHPEKPQQMKKAEAKQAMSSGAMQQRMNELQNQALTLQLGRARKGVAKAGKKKKKKNRVPAKLRSALSGRNQRGFREGDL